MCLALAPRASVYGRSPGDVVISTGIGFVTEPIDSPLQNGTDALLRGAPAIQTMIVIAILLIILILLLIIMIIILMTIIIIINNDHIGYGQHNQHHDYIVYYYYYYYWHILVL